MGLLFESEEEYQEYTCAILKQKFLIFSKEQVIDSAFSWFRKNGFPYWDLPVHICMQEINDLAVMEGEQLLGTNMATHVADTYHPHRFKCSKDDLKKRTPVKMFQRDEILKIALDLRMKYFDRIPAHYFSELSFVRHRGCSNFRAGFACFIYRKYCGENSIVLDTSTGYGGRLVGFIASGRAGKYIGIDPCIETYEGNKKLAEDMQFSDKVKLFPYPVEDIISKEIEEQCDFAFTSPPYFAAELYSEEPTQSYLRYPEPEEWKEGFLRPMLQLQFEVLKRGCFSLLNVDDINARKSGRTIPIVAWTKELAQEAGFKFEGTEKYRLKGLQQFGEYLTNRSKDEANVQEPLLIFRKP